MKKHPTLWTNREKKFKPINLQAAMVCIKAKDIHLPPPEPVTYTPNALDVRAKELAAQKLRVAEIEKQKAIELAEQERLRQEDRERQKENRKRRANSSPSNNWVARHLKRQAKAARKPPPTQAQIDAAKKAYQKGEIRV